VINTGLATGKEPLIRKSFIIFLLFFLVTPVLSLSAYSLNDDSIGVVFNDLTKLLLLADGQNIHYIDIDGKLKHVGHL
jgi:hypothetical protein